MLSLVEVNQAILAWSFYTGYKKGRIVRPDTRCIPIYQYRYGIVCLSFKTVKGAEKSCKHTGTGTCTGRGVPVQNKGGTGTIGKRGLYGWVTVVNMKNRMKKRREYALPTFPLFFPLH
jgi:hypothetical protein